DIQSLLTHSAQSLNMNDIGTVRVEADRPLVFDAYAQSRRTGSFILIDPDSNNTVAAGMITGAVQSVENRSNIPGLVVALASDDPALNLLEHYASAESGNVVIVSNWNRKAIDLLTSSGIHVVIRDGGTGAAGDHHDRATIEELL